MPTVFACAGTVDGNEKRTPPRKGRLFDASVRSVSSRDVGAEPLCPECGILRSALLRQFRVDSPRANRRGGHIASMVTAALSFNVLDR